MEGEDKVQITDEHLNIMREKYDCSNMTDDLIINAMLSWEKKQGNRYILYHLCFPNFQCVLNYYRSSKNGIQTQSNPTQ